MFNETANHERNSMRDFEEYEAARAYSKKDLNFINQREQHSILWNSTAISIEQQMNKQKRFSPVVLTMAWDNIGILISSNPSSFTQEELLESEEDQVNSLIERIRLLPILCKEKITNRLRELFNDAKEEDEFASIKVGSLRSFHNFLRLNINLKCPLIALTPENEIYASWEEGKDKIFSIKFLTSGEVRFIVFVPNKLQPNHQTRISGNTAAELLMKYVEPYGVFSWAME